MIKKLLTILFLLVFGNIQAQVEINEVNLTGNEILPSEYFNCIIFNSSSAVANVKLSARGEMENQFLFRFESSNLRLTTGINIIRGSLLTIVSKQYGTSELAGLYRQTGRIPSGTLDVCLTVTGDNSLYAKS
jgi:hypothetical protein